MMVRGSVRHPESQGIAERFNRTLLNLIRKVLEAAGDWRAELDMLLYYYRHRVHSATSMSPFEAMVGWKSRNLLIDDTRRRERSLSAWVDQMASQAAKVRDAVEAELSASDFIEQKGECPYDVGSQVMLRRSERSPKCQSPYELGWEVRAIISDSTVDIEKRRQDGQLSTKRVNVALLKPAPVGDALDDDGDVSETRGREQDAPVEIVLPVYLSEEEIGDDDEETDVGGPVLRDRRNLRLPPRYRD